jgi:hypothetical protein
MKKVIFSVVCALSIFSACEKIVFQDPNTLPIIITDTTPPTVTLTSPANNLTGVALSQIITATFSEAMNPLTLNASTFTVKQGTTAITGTVSYTGTQATFISSIILTPSTVYTGTITSGAKDLAGNPMSANYTFSFTTTATADLTPPTVTSVDPLNNATSVVLSKVINVNFSKAMNASTINATTFTLKLGTTAVAGTVNYTGVTASFTPSAALTPNSVYTGTITTGAKDLAGNALATNYTFSFTSGALVDIIPPTVASTDPLNNATGVATNKVIGITFSEAMTASTINATSFTLKQGTTAVTGTVGYTGNTATFAPTALLTAGTVYTASITTTAKDLAGNALTTATTWTFTTAGTAPAGKSFATDVVPVLAMCNSCHNHGWNTSANASTFYTNLLNAGYIKPSSYTACVMYQRMNNGHVNSAYVSSTNFNKIITWMQEGSKNN